MPVELIFAGAAVGLLATLLVLMDPPPAVTRRPVRRTVGLTGAQLRALQRSASTNGVQLAPAIPGAWDGVERRVAGIRSPKLEPMSAAERGTAAAGLMPHRERAS